MATNGLAQHVFDVERRRMEREEVFYRTMLTATGGATVPVDLVNISRTGFMARTDAPLTEGTRARIRLPVTSEMDARIVWALGGRVGAEFREPIEPLTYFKLLAALPRGN